MSFEFISNPTIKQSNSDYSRNLIRTNTESSGYLYQPNFVLISQSSISKTAVALFGDILPVYSSTKQLTNVIVTSIEGLNNLIFLSRTFAVCLLSLMNIVIHNTVYQAYTVLVSAYGQIQLLPDSYGHLRAKLENLIEVFTSSQGRELWWLELKIDVKSFLNRAYKLINLILEVSKKFYLTWVVCLVIGFLNYSVVFSNLSVKPNSFLSKFIQNYSLSVSASPVIEEAVQSTTLATPFTSNSVQQIQVITQYDVEEGDTLEQISYKFGVSAETIKLNNNISEDVTLNQKLFIPWVDGYIYNASKDISPLELEKVYKISAAEIQNQNISIFDTAISGFHKDSLVLIPTSEFGKIVAGNQILAAQKQSVELAKRSKTLAENSISYNKKSAATYKGSTSSEARSLGFIWPTSGNISRCFSSIHHGCDIASFASPPIYAAQKGVVRVGYEAGGYGNYVKIDHGNGLVTVYGHMRQVYVKTGQVVSQGEALGQMGQTGRSTGIHLHFEVQVNGVQVDPLPYLPARG